MFHQEPPQNNASNPSRKDIESILSEGVKDCRKIMRSMIEQKLPMNETPSFFYTVNNYLPKEITAVVTKEDQDHMGQRIRQVLKGNGEAILSALCLKESGGKTQFVVSLFCPSGETYALVILPPTLRDGKYHFTKPIPLSQPRTALSFLTNEEVYH